MSWLDTHKDAKAIETIEELKQQKCKTLYSKEIDGLITVDHIIGNNIMFFHINGELDVITFTKNSLYILYMNEEELAEKKKREEEGKAYNAMFEWIGIHSYGNS